MSQSQYSRVVTNTYANGTAAILGTPLRSSPAGEGGRHAGRPEQKAVVVALFSVLAQKDATLTGTRAAISTINEKLKYPNIASHVNPWDILRIRVCGS